MPKSKKMKLLLSSFSIITTTGIIATAVTSCGSATQKPKDAKTTVPISLINDATAVFANSRITPVIQKQLADYLGSVKFSNLLITPVNKNNIAYSKDKQLMFVHINATIKINSDINNVGFLISFNIKNKVYNIKDISIINSPISELTLSNIGAQVALQNQLNTYKLLTNVTIEVNAVKNAVVSGIISYTNSQTGTSDIFQNMQFQVKLEKQWSADNKTSKWITKDVINLLNINKLGRDMAKYDKSSQVYSSFNKNDSEINFATGSQHIKGWDQNAKDQTANNKLVKTDYSWIRLPDHTLEVKYPGIMTTTSINDQASRMAYTFTVDKQYDLTVTNNQSSSSITEVSASLTEATKQFGYLMPKFKNQDLHLIAVANTTNSWSQFIPATKKTIIINYDQSRWTIANKKSLN